MWFAAFSVDHKKIIDRGRGGEGVNDCRKIRRGAEADYRLIAARQIVGGAGCGIECGENGAALFTILIKYALAIGCPDGLVTTAAPRRCTVAKHSAAEIVIELGCDVSWF